MNDSILDFSRRTVTKIIKRLNLGCFECGWNETPGDLHHIIPKSLGGLDTHANLTHLCPNCHRKAHRGLLKTFTSLEDKIGDKWKDFYFPQKAGIKRTFDEISASRLLREEKRKIKLQKKEQIIKLILDSDINFNQYGWVSKVAPIIGISVNKVNQWMKLNMFEFHSKCFKRK
jgi:hypothetical protein